MEENRIRLIRIILTRSFLFLLLAMALGFILNTFFPVLLDELSEIRASDVIGVMGTVYALITAFILVNVWQEYNDTQASFSQENESIIEIWSYTDFFDDQEFSEKMKDGLLNYIKSALKELGVLAEKKQVAFPSPEFTHILKIIDSVKFNDDRDPIAFEGLTKAYKNLSSARAKRIEVCVNEIPRILRDFYILTSLIFWFGYLIEGFDSVLVYYIVLAMVSLIAIFAYVIIMDLDQPLKPGMVQVSFFNYHQSREYIEKTVHEIKDSTN
ncbi:MAG: DUF4239 domain-containing protein [Candidatus Heimdallarchaeota archaeon]|nr:DUF4239 domain-containing protein [Candidatus Heimdallarchaeota archaeon]